MNFPFRGPPPFYPGPMYYGSRGMPNRHFQSPDPQFYGGGGSNSSGFYFRGGSCSPQLDRRFHHPRGQFRGPPNGHFTRQPHPFPNNTGHQNWNSKSQNKKKNKVNKRELPENNRFYCDICDRGFKTDEKYQEHISGHEQCSIADCKYIAAPKLVKLHFQLQHKTGMAKKIWQLESKEDIDKWISERKRNYPTAANILRKKAAWVEMESRGEVLKTKYFGKHRSGNQQNDRNRRSKAQRGRHKHGRQMQKERTPDHEELEEDLIPPKRLKTDHYVQLNSKLPVQESTDKNSLTTESGNITGDPLSVLLDGVETESSSLSSDLLNKNAEASELGLTGGLASIMSAYADTDSDTLKQKSPPEAKLTASLSDSTIQKSPTFDKNHNRVSPTKKNGPLQNKQKHQRKKQEMFYRKRPTLLERLLAPEIRHERNIILQCVHYIVKKQFFDSATGQDSRTDCESETTSSDVMIDAAFHETENKAEIQKHLPEVPIPNTKCENIESRNTDNIRENMSAKLKENQVKLEDGKKINIADHDSGTMVLSSKTQIDTSLVKHENGSDGCVI